MKNRHEDDESFVERSMPAFKQFKCWFKRKFKLGLVDNEINEKTLRLPGLESKIISDELLTIKEVRFKKGGFAEIYFGKLGTYRGAPRTVVIKKFFGPTAIEYSVNEALIMKGLNHENILTLIGVQVREGLPHLVLPYMSNGDLLRFLLDENNILPDTDLLELSLDIAKGMAYLASQNIVHRDLAARNCLVDKNRQVKISDFRMSRRMDIIRERRFSRMSVLPVKWMAPESIEEHVFDQKTDVWSFGVTFWEIMTRGMSPYSEIRSTYEVVSYVLKGGRLVQPQFCSDRVFAIMADCWEGNPGQRPTFGELLDTIPYRPVSKKASFT